MTTSTKRNISYAEAIREALDQSLSNDPRFFVMGQGVDDPNGMFGTTIGLQKKHGRDRVFDTPLSENALTGIAVGAAISGSRTFYMHNRPDFLLLAMDQIVNHASKWSYMFGGHVKVPLVIWACVGRGWGSAAQHSQALHGLFMHIPGLKIVMPSTAYDAKGLYLTAIADGGPVLIFEHRLLLEQTGLVPEKMYSIPFGKGVVRRKGKAATIVGISYMAIEALRAAEKLADEGIDVEVIDLRTIKPLDEEIILNSVKKTGRLLIADTGWKTGGVSAEIAALVAEKGFTYLKKRIARVASPDAPTPAGHILESKFYPGPEDIIKAVKELLS
jgi:acetoin:2,6-dichlorophenolindophenol oxidoreductase subunit beta